MIWKGQISLDGFDVAEILLRKYSFNGSFASWRESLSYIEEIRVVSQIQIREGMLHCH